MQRATLDLYAAEGTTPFAGCLPMLAQAPVTICAARSRYQNGIEGRFRCQEIAPMVPARRFIAIAARHRAV